MNFKADGGLAVTRTCRLGDLLDFRNDIVHPKDKPSGSAIFVGLEHIEQNTGFRLGEIKLQLSEMTGRRARFRAGDIVYGYLRPYLNKVWIAEFDGLCSVDQYVFVVRPGFDRNYIARFLRSEEFLKTAPVDQSPGQLPRIRSGEIAATPIRLPPLDEQRRIAAILDKADALRRKRKRALDLQISLADGLVESTFRNAVVNRLLGEVFEVQGGLQITASRRVLPIDIPYLRVANVYRDRLDLTEVKTMRVTEPELTRTTLRKGDILFVEGHGNPDQIGRCAVWNSPLHSCVHQNHLIRARPLSSEVEPMILSRWLNGSLGRKHLLRRGKTTSGLNTISVSDVKAIPIPILRRSDQEGLLSQMRRISDLEQLWLAQIASLADVFTSLQSRAFSGQL